jgi:hypothetical protein
MAESNVAAAFAVKPIEGQAPTDAGISSPDLDAKTLKPKRRSLTSIEQAFQIIDALTMARRSQNEKNGRIQGKLNSERPYDDAKLETEGLGYKSNVSTRPLATTVGKVSSRLTKSIQSARYLTSAQLPDSIPGAKEKTELFRDEITNCLRRWPGWYDFVNSVADEDSKFGWAVAAWLDEVEWHPVFFRQDEAFLPDGTKHSVDTVQFAAFRQFIFPHELANFIWNRKAAEAAGWDVENVVESLNGARVQTVPSTIAAPYTDFRRYEDALRESTVTLSLTGGAKQILLWHVFVTEIDGKISHYIADGNSKKELYRKEDRFERVADCLALLSYEQGNGKLMGSKGIGREVYEIAGALDRARNECIDRLQMSGKILVSGPENQISRFKLTVLGNVALIPEGFNVQQNKIEASVEDFIAIDRLLTGLLDGIAGSVTPRSFDRERVTKAEVQLYAEREEEKRDDVATRFVTQFANGIISTCQRRICSKKVKSEDAKQVREKLLRFMSEEELEYLANQPALRTIEDFTETDAQKIILFAQEHRGDPLYNQRELQKRAASAYINPEFAEAVLAPENDPAQTAEQMRQQSLESVLLERGREVPVSPRDDHVTHVETLKQDLQTIAQAAGDGDPQALQVLQGFAKHWQDHLVAADAGGVDKAWISAQTKELTSVAKQIGELQAEAAVKEQQAQLAALPVAPAQ